MMKITNSNESENKVLLKVRNVKKFFNTPSGVLKAIDDISFDVKPGEIIGLIGESGSGKTTVGRCLIRLYDQYSGLVSFQDEVISGAKLSKKQKIFLNQNIQMIFQDPHASLNPQHNIYTILKEPLIVNKIMKSEYKDFFSDWSNVTKNFRYSFLEYSKKIELDNTMYHTLQARQYLKEWTNVLNRIKFKYDDVENDFNQYFGYLLSDQQHESNVISKMFDNNTKLLDFYFKSQNEYRQGNILFVEKELKEAKEKLEKTIKYSNKSITLINLKEEIAQIKQAKKDILNKFNENKKNIFSIINSYLKEFQNDYQSNLDSAHSTTDYIVFNKYIKYYYLYKKVHESLNKVKHSILHINNIEFDKSITNLKLYKDNMLIDIESKFNENSINYKNDVKQYIQQNFNFNFNEEIAISEQRKTKHTKEIDAYNEIIDLRSKLLKNKFDDTHSITQQDIEKAKKIYETINNQNESEIKKFLVGFNSRMNNYQQQIDHEKKELESIRLQIKELSDLFEIKHKEFIEGLLNKLLGQKENPSKVKNIINSYESRVKQKLESLESFKIEVHNLNNDFNKLMHLLGICKSKTSKSLVKNILIKEKIYKSLEEVGLLRQFAWRYPHEFSGGQRQRIVIARALISNPKLIIADEPIASLDVSIQAQVVNILKDLCQKKNISMIFIAHDLSMVEYIANYVLIMHLGKIVEAGETDEIYQNPIHPYTKNLFESIPKISNANKKFEATSFENEYLVEQQNENVYIDYFKVNDKHDIYCSFNQYIKWTNGSFPQLSRFTKHQNKYNTEITKLNNQLKLKIEKENLNSSTKPSGMKEIRIRIKNKKRKT